MTSDTSWIWTPETNSSRRLMRQTTVMTITPDIAKAMLASQDYNRRPRQTQVVALASAMSRGEWRTTHQGFAFDDTGRLIDGQHRLKAVILSGVSIEAMVTIGCNKTDFEVLDSGVLRSAADRLREERHIADVARLACNMFGNSKRPSVEQMRAILSTGLDDKLERLRTECPTRCNVLSSACVRLAAGLRMMEREECQKWICSQYRAMVLRKYEEIDPMPRSFLSAVDRHVVHATERHPLFVRATVAFDFDRRMDSKVRISQDRLEQAMDWARSVLRQS